MPELLHSVFVVVTREAGNLIVVRRTAIPTSSQDVTQFAADFLRLVPLSERRTLMLLHDMREAPLLGDPEVERTIVQHAPAMMQGFARWAIVMRTAVGKLQAGRMQREYGWQGAVFDDDAAARAFLAGHEENGPGSR